MIDPKATGIIFPNVHDDCLPELLSRRTMASLPFCGRYRMIDFCLSGMANAGIQNIAVIAKKNYQSLMDHLGNGREWDLSRKRGGLVIFPPYGREQGEYTGRIESMASVLGHMEGLEEELVVMSDCDIAYNLDYKDLLQAHQRTGADVTAVYEQCEMSESLKRNNVAYALNDMSIVTGIRVNEYKKGTHNVGMNIFVMRRDFLINMVRECMVRGKTHFVPDVLVPNVKKLKIFGYRYSGYSARICDMQSYFTESLRLLSYQNLNALFPAGHSIYTKVRDEAPVRYSFDATCKNSLLADGCIIEGEVDNCVLFRGVRVGKGAKLKNCIIMQGSEIGPAATLENVVTDKNVKVGPEQVLHGAASFPVFIAKGSTVV